MKKRIMLFLSLSLIVGVGSTAAFAEENSKTQVSEKTEIITQTTETKKKETDVKPTSKPDKELIHDRTRNLNILLANKYITQAEHDKAMQQLQAATTNAEVDEVLNNVLEGKREADLFLWSFAESYINLKANIKGLLEDGRIEPEFAAECFEKIEAAVMKSELEEVSKKIGAIINENPDIGIDPPKTTDQTNFTTTTNTTNPTTKPTTKPTTSPNKLPQTGEQKSKWMMIVGGIIIIAVVVVIVMKNKGKTKEVEDKTEDE